MKLHKILLDVCHIVCFVVFLKLVMQNFYCTAPKPSSTGVHSGRGLKTPRNVVRMHFCLCWWLSKRNLLNFACPWHKKPTKSVVRTPAKSQYISQNENNDMMWEKLNKKGTGISQQTFKTNHRERLMVIFLLFFF